MTSCFRLNYPDGVTVIYSLRMAVHAVASPIQGLSSFLENYWCRNQVFRTVQFASGMLSGLLETSYPDVAGKLMIVSGSISEMRVMLRLLDDLPALAYNLQNWKPKKVIKVYRSHSQSNSGLIPSPNVNLNPSLDYLKPNSPLVGFISTHLVR